MSKSRRTIRASIICAAAGLPWIATAGCTADSGTTIAIDFETTEGTKLAFDVSPDGQTIVFDLLGQIWTMPAAGGRAEPVTDAVRDSSEDLDPIFAPDGASVAFRADRPGGPGLFSASLIDGEVRRLTDQPAWTPAWSPDGNRLAFVQGQTIYLVGPQGEDPESLVIDGLPSPYVSAPAWSPTDDRLVFVNAFPGGAGRLWGVSTEGGIAEALTEEGVRAMAPAYAPAGGLLAFFAPDSVPQPQVWVMEPGGVPVKITSQEDVTPLRLRWTPDGSRIVYHAGGRLRSVSANGGDPSEIPFTARVQLERRNLVPPEVHFPPSGSEFKARGHMGLALAPGGSRIAMIALGQLWVLDVGEAPKAVATLPFTAAGLSWSPDEESVVWSAGRGGDEDLFATELTTGQTRQITALPGSELAPSWSPDGRNIAFIHWEKPALSTPAYDYSDAGTRLRMVPSDGPLVESKDGTTDLSDGFTTWGFMGPNMDAPAWSPDHEANLIALGGGRGILVSLSGEVTSFEVPFSPTYLTWTEGGNLVFVEDGLLWRAPFDPGSGSIGEPTRMSDDAALYASTSRDGSVLYMSSDGLRIQRRTGEVEALGWPLSFETPSAGRLLIRNVRIAHGTGAAGGGLSDILTEDGRIVRISPAGTLDGPDGVRVLDAEGRIAIPGLVDLHAHSWDDAVLPAALFYGVTAVRDMGSNGIARLAGFRDATEAGIWPGPRILLGGVQFWGRGTFTGGGGYEVSGDSARGRAMDLMAAFRTDYLKTRLFDDWEGTAKLVEAAHEKGWPVSGHIALPLPLIAAGIDGMEHLGPSGFRTDEIVYEDQIQLFRHAGLWVVPTTVGYSSVPLLYEDPTLFDEPETESFTTPFLEWWAFRMPPTAGRSYGRFARFTRLSARKLHEGGVTLGAGTDAPILPWAMHTELEELVAIGLSPLQAIEAGTRKAAEILGAGAEIGTIEEGKWADLVLLNADPLEDIRNTRKIWKVIKGGVEVDREALRELASGPRSASIHKPDRR